MIMRKGTHHSEESKLKLRITQLGRKNPVHSDFMKGRHVSEETRVKMSLAHRGLKHKPMSNEGRLNLSEALKGRVPWNKGKIGMCSEETLARMRAANKLAATKWDHSRTMLQTTKDKLSIVNTGKKHTEEQKRKISDSMKGYKPTPEHRMKLSLVRRGEKSSNWKGGITPENKLIRCSVEYKLWREAVYKRDKWTCQKCLIRGGKLHPHHIKHFADYPELRFAIDNGSTLCVSCHKLEHRTAEVIGMIRVG
jgi:hypothetical protein